MQGKKKLTADNLFYSHNILIFNNNKHLLLSLVLVQQSRLMT